MRFCDLYRVTLLEDRKMLTLPAFTEFRSGKKFMCKAALFTFIVFSVMIDVYVAGSTTNNTDPEIFPISLLGQRAAQLIKNRLLRRQERVKLRTREICYDVVGCFPMPRTQVAALKKPPQPPEEVDTKFILLTRDRIKNNDSYFLSYGDQQQSLINSSFDRQLPSKLIVHGFKGSGQDKGAVDIAAAFLELENDNIILVDWHKGAAGPSYVSAAANTQLVGRQLALLIMNMIAFGANPADIHIIGFSLGAHIAGYAGRTTQKKKVKIGRITGLDPASPLFRELLATSLSPLKKTDATFVDVIHTDGAKFLSEGLGIFNPIGHVDYFPNGGFDQPGCNHVRGAVLASHIGGSLNTNLVCNHLRAWQLFLESLKAEKNGCEFLSFPCPGGWSNFQKGQCFPTQCTDETCGKMGYYTNKSKLRGPLYLSTRDSSPFCGYQLKASVLLSKNMPSIRGYMQLSIYTETDHTHFQLYSDFRDELRGGYVLNGITAAPFRSINNENGEIITVHISCFVLNQKQTTRRQASTDFASIDEVMIRDIYGHIWYYYTADTSLTNINGTNIEAVTVKLKLLN